jgi:hypothetical protein
MTSEQIDEIQKNILKRVGDELSRSIEEASKKYTYTGRKTATPTQVSSFTPTSR